MKFLVKIPMPRYELSDEMIWFQGYPVTIFYVREPLVCPSSFVTGYASVIPNIPA